MNKEIRNQLLSLIPEAPDHVSMKILAKKMGVSQRELRRLILLSRISGHVILSDENGYCVSHNRDDVRKFYKRIQQRQKHTAQAIAAVRAELRKSEDDSRYEQMSLFKEASI